MDINVDVNKGRVPLIAGCHHQNPNEVMQLAKHAQSVGIDFVIILTPYVAARGDDAIYEFYKYVCERIDIGVVLFNTEATYPDLARTLAKRLAKIPNICRIQAGRVEDLVHHRAARRDRQGARDQRRRRGAVGLQHGRHAAITGCSTTARTCTRCRAICR